jgi:STE24 endopeptidase
VNAGVTGSLPWFRYEFLSDALVESLSPHEIAAVFGHEIGHIAHRHLPYFGFFIVGSLGVLALATAAINQMLDILQLPAFVQGTPAALVLEVVSTLALVGGYLLFVFGFLSRRFERQADIFGCRVVSCGVAECPPHRDLDGLLSLAQGTGPASPGLCRVGIETFVSALANVAVLNGMKPSAWSWRHGSILRRITFLEGLLERPEVERRFQSGLRWIKWGMAVALLAALALVWATG